MKTKDSQANATLSPTPGSRHAADAANTSPRRKSCLYARLLPLAAAAGTAIGGPPQIGSTTSLQHKAVYVGMSASFAVTAQGDAPLSYQWRLDGRDLPSQTNETLSLPSVQPADEGDYTVVVSNSEGQAVSDQARLWVVPPANQAIRRDYTNEAGQRLPYFYYVPADYTPSNSYPMLVHMAGAGNNEDNMIAGAETAPEFLVFRSYLCTPLVVDWFLAQQRGLSSAVGPFLSITSPTEQADYATGAATLSLSGAADALGQAVTRISWTNLANRTNGDASGTNSWSATGLPLQADKTNVVIVIATTTSWAPAFGGNTTFNDTLAVFYSPIRATISLQGSATILNWTGAAPPYAVQHATDLVKGDWADQLINADPPVSLPTESAAGFYRVVGK